MKALVVFYSRTGITKEVAVRISEELDCDIEEIFDVKSRNGIFGYIRSAFESIFKKIPKIKKTEVDPSDYDLVIIGTPVWAENMASPVRSYLFKNSDFLNRIAFFCTMLSRGSKKTFLELERLSEFNPLACLALTDKEIKQEKHIKKVKEFIKEIKKNYKKA